MLARLRQSVSFMENIEYKNVQARVRPHRVAVLINSNDKYWKTYVKNLIGSFSMAWGGEYFLIIPTDGKTIDERFWAILKEYSPDVIARYIPSILDLEDADPKRYKLIKDNWYEQWKKIPVSDVSEIEEKWPEAARGTELNSTVEASEELKKELKNRLSPFGLDEYIVSENVWGNQFPGYPLTSILDINKNAKKPIVRLTVPFKLQNTELNLLALSRTGSVNPSLIEEYKKKNIEVLELSDNTSTSRYLEMLEGKENTRGYVRSYFMQEEDGSALPEDFDSTFPFKNSMLNLTRYYRTDIHDKNKENFKVIIGDTLEDFCLYYNLSRIHDGVTWIPDGLLRETNSLSLKIQNDETEEKFSDDHSALTQLIYILDSQVRFGHPEKEFELMSMSLTKRQLGYRKRYMQRLCLFNPDQFGKYLNIEDSNKNEIKCVFRVIESDNFHQQQDVIFKDGKSMGRFQTPKPKHYYEIDPSEHRWITQLEIEDYKLPPLPYLSELTFSSLVKGYDCRVSVDGLAYFCPNPMLFGGDIDTVLVKPKLNILSANEFFTHYFTQNGYSTQLSDKGSYLKDTIDKFGGLQTTADFFRPELTRKMFDQYLFDNKDDSESNKENLRFLDVDRRTYLSFDAFNDFIGSNEDTSAMLDVLVGSSVLYRGYIFKCDNCRRTDWYGIEEVSRTFKCKRCEEVQSYTHSKWMWSSEPIWYYRLAETVYQFYRSHSYITAIVLDKIRADSKESFMYLSESDIIDSDGKKKEIDIIALSDGKIILGECKDTKPANKDIGKYVNMFKQFEYKPDEFILATTEEHVSERIDELLSQIKNSKKYFKSDIL